MSRPFNRFDSYAFDLGKGLIRLDRDELYILLTHAMPLRVYSRRAELVEIRPGNGYMAGGMIVEGGHFSQSGAGSLFTGRNVLFEAKGGRMAAFQFAILYDATATGQPLIGYWDYGAALTLAEGESLLVEFDQSKILRVGQ